MQRKISIVSLIVLIATIVFGAYELIPDGVKFTYTDIEAQQVSVAGSFNNWSQDANPMTADESGVFTTTIAISSGEHFYKFVVDGVWKEDPDNPDKGDDGYGGVNSVLNASGGEQQIQSPASSFEGKAEFSYFNPDAREVYLTGDFTNWSPTVIPMQKQSDGTWLAKIDLESGEYEYKYVVDGNWLADPLNPVTRGDFGNSLIEIDDDGEAIIPGGAQVQANSTASSRILFSGKFLSKMLTFRDRDLPDGYTGDKRWKLYKPLAKMDVNLRVNVTQGVSAFGTFNVNTFDAENIYEAHLHLDSVGIVMENDDFKIEGFFNREVEGIDDPLGLLRNYKYAEPTFEELQSFGMGYAGISFDTEIRRTFMSGTKIRFLAANMFQDWSASPPVDTMVAHDLQWWFGRRQQGFWMNRITCSEEPSDFSDYGTDVVAGRIAREIGQVTPGISFRIDRNRWWLPTSEIVSEWEYFDTIYAAHELHSDWLDLGSFEYGIGGDISASAGSLLDIWGEYLYLDYRSSLDAGNRENSDFTGDSTLDITLGEQTGYLAGGGLTVHIAGNIDLSGDIEFESYNAMGLNQAYIYPHHNDGSTGRPTLTFDRAMEWDRYFYTLEGLYSLSFFSFGISYDLVHTDSSFTSLAFSDTAVDTISETNSYSITPQFKLRLFDDRLTARSKLVFYSIEPGTPDAYPRIYDVYDFLFNVKWRFAKNFAVEGDVFFKNSKVRMTINDTTEFSGRIETTTEKIIAPYLAFIYEPKAGIFIEISTGVRPYNLRGQYCGRAEWIYDTMSDNGISYTNALERMELFQGINLFAVVKF